MKAYERLLRYVTYNTRSDATTGKTPSTPGQLKFAEMLLAELDSMGIKDVSMDEYGYIYGSIAANCNDDIPATGLIAHMDTAENLPGPSETPEIIKNYDGKAFTLKNGTLMDPAHDLNLAASTGDDIIVTNGETLLGGDDKAGLASIMTVLEYFVEHPEVKHGKICFSFTPDEEIGESQDHFDVEKFGAKYAYTLDGESCNEIQYENFYGDTAYVKINGFDFHPGSSKNVMINAVGIGTEFNSMLPPCEKPEHTELYEGFYHLTTMHGNEESCEMEYLLRDHNHQKMIDRKNYMTKVAELLNMKYGEGVVEVRVENGYRNMYEIIKNHMEVVEDAKSAINDICGSVKTIPIRGGTDGAELSYNGVPCPNLGTGSYNHHSTVEFANIQQMDKLVEVVIALLSR